MSLDGLPKVLLELFILSPDLLLVVGLLPIENPQEARQLRYAELLPLAGEKKKINVALHPTDMRRRDLTGMSPFWLS